MRDKRMKSALDYLRIASWDDAGYGYVASYMLEGMPGKWEQGKWLQYQGWRQEGVFFGRGEQGKDKHGWPKHHCVISISGFLADEWHEDLHKLEEYYATRLDVQVTIKQPKSVYLDEVYARIKNHVKTSLIQSDENDTLYVGARTSEIFTRLYEKILDTKYLRLEFELKGGRSHAAWRALRSGATTDEIFSHYLKKSTLPADIKNLFRLAEDGETEHAMRMEIEKDDAKTLAWLQSIDGAMMKALSNHNIGSQVEQLLMGWVGFAGNIDRLSEED